MKMFFKSLEEIVTTAAGLALTSAAILCRKCCRIHFVRAILCFVLCFLIFWPDDYFTFRKGLINKLPGKRFVVGIA